MAEIWVVAEQYKAKLQDEIDKIDWFLSCADTLLQQGETAIPTWKFDAAMLKAASSLKHDEPLAAKTEAPAAKDVAPAVQVQAPAAMDEKRANLEKPSAPEVEAPVAEPAAEPDDELRLGAEARVADEKPADEKPADEKPADEKPEVASDAPVRRSLFRGASFRQSGSEAEAAA